MNSSEIAHDPPTPIPMSRHSSRSTRRTWRARSVRRFSSERDSARTARARARVRITPQIAGLFMYHCHNLEHEDLRSLCPSRIPPNKDDHEFQ